MIEFDRMMENATERAERAIESGDVEPYGAFRFGVEMDMIAREKKLVPPTAKDRFAEHLRNKGISGKDFRALPTREKRALLHEALGK